jgi:predicted MPP superfamily phosphohydrolase
MEILDNENIDFKELNIIGISDNTLRDEKIVFINNLIKNEKFNICMVHQPSIWDDVSENIDVMLSGHTHKGQIFPFNFLVKLKFKYIYGEYQLNNGTLFVSSGAGTWGPRMRLGSFNEILKINLSTQ